MLKMNKTEYLIQPGPILDKYMNHCKKESILILLLKSLYLCHCKLPGLHYFKQMNHVNDEAIFTYNAFLSKTILYILEYCRTYRESMCFNKSKSNSAVGG